MFANHFNLFLVLILIFTTIITCAPMKERGLAIDENNGSAKSIENLNDNNNNLDPQRNDKQDDSDDDDDDDHNQQDIKENNRKINRQKFKTPSRYNDLEPLSD